MAKPITPMVAAEVFVLNDKGQVLLVKRADDGTWCMPGGCQDLTETPAECAARECREESGYQVRIKEILGVFSSRNFEWVHYKFKDDVFVHLLFRAELEGGEATLSPETTDVGWFSLDQLPTLLDGHENRIRFASKKCTQPGVPVFFE